MQFNSFGSDVEQPSVLAGLFILVHIMEGKNKVIVYADWISTFEELSDAEAGRLVKHFFRYINDKNPEPPNKIIRIAFEHIKQTLKRDLAAWKKKSEKNAENANIRWHGDANDANASEPMPPDANHADKDIDKDKDIVIDTVKDNDTEKEKFKKPSVSEIKDYCLERKNKVDAETFFDHYETRGWIPKGSTKIMKDWRAAVRTWEKKNFNPPNGTTVLRPKDTIGNVEDMKSQRL